MVPQSLEIGATVGIGPFSEVIDELDSLDTALIQATDIGLDLQPRGTDTDLEWVKTWSLLRLQLWLCVRQ